MTTWTKLGKAGKRRRSGGSKLPAAQRSRGSSSRSRRSSEPPARSEAGGSDDESIPAAIGARVTSWFEDDEWYAGVIAACATFVPGMFFIKYDDGDDEWASLPDPMVRVVKRAPHKTGKNNMLDIDGRVAAELRLLRAQMKKEQLALRKVSSEKLKAATAKAKRDARAAWAGKKAPKSAPKESKVAAAAAAANAAKLEALMGAARAVEQQLSEANLEVSRVEGAHTALEKRNAALERERDALAERERALQKQCRDQRAMHLSLAGDLRAAQAELEASQGELIARVELQNELAVARARSAMQTPQLERQKLHMRRANERLRDAAHVEEALRREIEELRSRGAVTANEW